MFQQILSSAGDTHVILSLPHDAIVLWGWRQRVWPVPQFLALFRSYPRGCVALTSIWMALSLVVQSRAAGCTVCSLKTSWKSQYSPVDWLLLYSTKPLEYARVWAKDLLITIPMELEKIFTPTQLCDSSLMQQTLVHGWLSHTVHCFQVHYNCEICGVKSPSPASGAASKYP